MTATSHEFKAEVRKVLNILTNSLYTNREIFLRELISNASDALDKVRFAQNRGQSPQHPELPLEIRIELDKEAKTITIHDTGIGMNAEELADNLGTIARSGSEAFLASLAEESAATSTPDKENAGAPANTPDAAQIIGRFGVGFYSIFMIANSVAVTSRPNQAGAEATTWTSDGLGTFTLTPAQEGPERGTVIVAHLKDNASEFLESYRIENTIRRHSSFIPFPIYLDGKQVNTQPALWREPKFSITAEQYSAFYKSLTYDAQDPMDTLHFSVDAPVQFTALLFIPHNSAEIWTSGRDQWGLDLYARRVLIQHENKELIPEYLAFLKGVVDTEDLPLNISRETLQENLIIRKMQQTIVKQTLNHLEKMAKDKPDNYLDFWKRHGKVFKMGYQDFVNRDRIASLMRFSSSRTEHESVVSLDQYIERAREGQKVIWHVAAPSNEAAKLNPHSEIFRRKGIEVLYLLEPLDEFVMDGLGKYKDWEIKGVEFVTDDYLKDFSDTEEGASTNTLPPLSEEEQGTFDALVSYIKTTLGDKVKDVRISHRLADSPACLVSPDGTMSSSMEKLMRVMQKDDSMPVKILEVNQNHPLLRTMLRIHNADANDTVLPEMIQALFDASLLLDGYLKDPQALASRTTTLLAQAGAWYTEVRKI